jgi:hypothetical protein
VEETTESLRVREQQQHQQNRAEAEQQQNRTRHGLLPLATKNRGQELLPSVQQKRTNGWQLQTEDEWSSDEWTS